MNLHFLWIVAPVALSLAAWWATAYAARSDYRHGQQAFLDGLRLNVRWPSRMRAGWIDEWEEFRKTNAAANLYRKLNEETDR